MTIEPMLQVFASTICTFQSQPVVYTIYDRATIFVPFQRKLLSFIIAHSAPGLTPKEVCDRINTRQTCSLYDL